MTNHIEVNDYMLVIERRDPETDRIFSWLEIEIFEDEIDMDMGVGNDEEQSAHIPMCEKEVSAICKFLLKWLNRERSLLELNI
jgi:hypothetical protein